MAQAHTDKIITYYEYKYSVVDRSPFIFGENHLEEIIFFTVESLAPLLYFQLKCSDQLHHFINGDKP